MEAKAMEQERQHLYLFMNDKQHSFCLYRIGDLQVYGKKASKSISFLDKPLLEMDKSKFPENMSFIAIGSRIFMLGGWFHNSVCSSNKLFIYDTLSNTVVSGPDLNSGKGTPYLFTFGSKLFAFSHLLYFDDEEDHLRDDRNPRFEMLDTNNPESKWSPLPLPVLQVSEITYCYPVCGAAAVYVDGRPVIFISAHDAGTYAFEVDKLVWSYVCAEILPVYENAVTIPHAPSMCCGHSLISDRFAAFRFFYEVNGKGFGFKEIPVKGFENLPSLGPPLLLCQRSLPIVFGPDNRVYFIDTGVDEAASYSSATGNRYVMVYALDFEGVSLDLNVPRPRKRRRRKKKQIEHGGDQVVEVRKCTKKKQMGRDEEQDEMVEVVVDKGQSSKSSKKKEENSRNWNDEEQDETTKVEEDTTKEFKLIKLSSIWGERFFGGPAVEEIIHVLGAFAM